jgi:hypothetical protein
MAIEALEQEPCEDCVSRKGVLNTLNRMDSVLDEDQDRTVETYKESLIACYNDLPPVKPVACIAKVNFSKEDMQELVNEKMKDIVVERKKGKWIKEMSLLGWDGCSYQCSECGRSIHLDTEVEDLIDYPYCHCGVEMRIEDDN